MTFLTGDTLKLAEIFFPHALERTLEAMQSGLRLVHYTKADSAVKIIRSKKLWMRAGPCMNDYAEVQHGLECLQAAFRSKPGEEFRQAVDQLFSKPIFEELAQEFDAWTNTFTFRTYVACLSEHSASEDENGRLAMWQTYGQGGVGLVINMAAFFQDMPAFGAFSSPVAYFDADDVGRHVARIAASIRDNHDFVAAQGRDTVRNYLMHALRGGAVCTKHRGFKDEHEWRIVHTDRFDDIGVLTMEVEVIAGVPQPVYKIPLDLPASSGFAGITIPDLLDRIIIGPLGPATAQFDAFVHLLQETGVPDAEKKVFISKTPLRY